MPTIDLDFEPTIIVRNAKGDDEYEIKYLSDSGRTKIIEGMPENASTEDFIFDCLKTCLVNFGDDKKIRDFIAKRPGAAVKLVKTASNIMNFDDSLAEEHEKNLNGSSTSPSISQTKAAAIAS